MQTLKTTFLLINSFKSVHSPLGSEVLHCSSFDGWYLRYIAPYVWRSLTISDLGQSILTICLAPKLKIWIKHYTQTINRIYYSNGE